MRSNHLLLWLTGLLTLWPCLGLMAQSASNAQIINANVNCRAHPPQFAVATLFTRELPPGELVAVVAANTRVTALSRTVISQRDEWVRIRTPNVQVCWIYTGPEGHPLYLRMDPGKVVGSALGEGEDGSLPGSAQIAPRNTWVDWVPLAAAVAQKPPLHTAVEPSVPADPARTLIFGAAMAAILLATFIGLSRLAFPGSPSHAVVAGLLIATAMGAVSQSLLPEVLVQVATRWVLPEAAMPEGAQVAESYPDPGRLRAVARTAESH